MIIICDAPGQTCNRLWSYLSSVALCIAEHRRMVIIFYDLTDYYLNHPTYITEIEEAADKKDAKANADQYQRLDYAKQREVNGPSRIGGVLYAADLDITNPLAYGIHSRELFTMKSGNYVLPRPTSNFASLVQLKGDKQLGGYLTKENQKRLKDATVVAYDNLGQGTVVLFSESPTYRGYWFSTSRILTNALFFGKNVSGGNRYRP